MLLIDVGNSRIKWSVWQNNQMADNLKFFYGEENLQDLLLKNLANVSRQKVFVCSVANPKIGQIITKWFDSYWFKQLSRWASR